MSSNVKFRSLTASDGPALAGLSYSSPDGGEINYASNYQIDAVQALQALHGDMEGVAAVGRDQNRLVGTGLVRFGECHFEGEIHPFGLIGNVIVHPDYRRQGLAGQIVDCLLDRAKARFGERGVIAANMQYGNAVSLRLFDRWMEDITDPLVYIPLWTRPDAPAALRGLMVGPLDEDEYDTFAKHRNAFYSDFNLSQPETGVQLRALCQRTPLGTPFRHAYAAIDGRGKLLAGLMVMEEFRLKQMEIRGMPTSLRALDKLVHFVPPDGTVRGVYLDHIWFLPGQALAARHLVETVRWIWAGRATYVSVYIDPRSPLREVFPTRPWSVKVRSSMAVKAPGKINKRRWVCPIY